MPIDDRDAPAGAHDEHPASHETFEAIVMRRLDRRAAIRELLGLGALGLLGAAPGPVAASRRRAPAQGPPAIPGFDFEEIAHGVDETHLVSPGHRADILIRWGDPLTPGAPAFDPYGQSVAAQRGQFGYNNDFIGFIPLPFGSNSTEHGLLCVNHEYSSARLMFPGERAEGAPQGRERAEIEMASHGGSVIEVKRVGGRWTVVTGSPHARRINALDTTMRIGGPAAGHHRLRTSADPAGTTVVGTLNNCGGGITPWGTYLMAEENFDKYFSGRLEKSGERLNFTRYGIPGGNFDWGRHHPRFDIGREPNEANRFGWIVEVDPLAPDSVPVKRTALGRMKHEGAACLVNTDGRLVVYSGDDDHLEFLYRFVSRDAVDRQDRTANLGLLDHGTLSAARFDDDGSLRWLPLRHGQAGLTADNGFHDQGDVLIEARRAASLLGATPMDRPEDVEANPVSGKVYVMLTGHSRRPADAVDAANPRAENLWGHILELSPADGDHAADTGRWELLIRAGDPAQPRVDAVWHPATSPHGWFACPDNCAIDPSGRLWVASDQGNAWQRASGSADGLWALETEGEGRGTGRMFFRVPVGAELCGPCFTPDGKTLFLAVQHPGSDGTRDFAGFGRRSSFDDPATRWPDFDPQVPPRPSVVVITRADGGRIGG